MDHIENGQSISCNGLYGTVIGKRSTRNQRSVLVKMDNGFTLKLNVATLSVGLQELSADDFLKGARELEAQKDKKESIGQEAA